MCRALQYDAKTSKTANIIKAHCSQEKHAQKYQINSVNAACTAINWSRDSQKYDIYTNEEGMYELLFPYVRQQLSDKLHAMEIEDLTSRAQALNFTNEGERQAHRQQILRLNEEHQQSMKEEEQEIDDLIKNRHVACRGCFYNVLCFIKKNSGKGHPYYVIRCQYRHLQKHKRWLKLRYPNMEVADECDDPNAIHRWNIFKLEVIKKPNYYRNHFILMKEK